MATGRDGTRGGEYQISPRLSFFGGATTTRNNIEDNPNRPTLTGDNLNIGSSLLLPWQLSLTFNQSHSSLSSNDAGAIQKTSSNFSFLQLMRSLRGLNLAYRYQQQSFSTVLGQGFSGNTLRYHELEALRNFRHFGTLDGSFRVQQSATGSQTTNTLFGRLGATISLGSKVSFYGRGELGRDLSNETLFSLNTVKTAEGGFQIHLPRRMSLNGRAFLNSLRIDPNQENLFFASSVAGAPVATLFSLARSIYMLELSKSFNWGSGELPPPGLPSELLSKYIPEYGFIDGYVFDDRNGNGERDKDEEGLPFVTVVVDGREVQSDREGHFTFDHVRTGIHQVQVPLDKVPALYSLPSKFEWTLEVRQNSVTPLAIPIQVFSSLRGNVVLQDLSGQRQVFPNLRVVLRPSGAATLTDQDGNFAFDGLVPGFYEVSADLESLPENIRMQSAPTYKLRIVSGRDISNIQFVLQEIKIERPIEKVPVQGRSTITLPAGNPNRR